MQGSDLLRVKRERPTDSCSASGSASGSASTMEKPFSAPAQIGIIYKDPDTKQITVWPAEWAREGRYPNTVGVWPLVMDAAQQAYVFELNKMILKLIRWKPDKLDCLTDLVSEHNTTPFYSIASIARESGLAEDTVLFTCVFMNFTNENELPSRRSTRKTHRRYEVNVDNAAISAMRSHKDPAFDRTAPGPY